MKTKRNFTVKMYNIDGEHVYIEAKATSIVKLYKKLKSYCRNLLVDFDICQIYEEEKYITTKICSDLLKRY